MAETSDFLGTPQTDQDRQQRLAHLQTLLAQRNSLEDDRQSLAVELAAAQRHVAAIAKHLDYAGWELAQGKVTSLKDQLTRLRTQKRLLADQITALEKVTRRDAHLLPSTAEALLGAAKMLRRWKLQGVVFLGEEEQVYELVQQEAARIDRAACKPKGRAAR